MPSPLLICTREAGLFLTKWPGITLGWPIGLSPHPPQFGCWVVGLRSPVSSKLDPACHTVTDLLPASHSTNRMSVLQRHTHIYTQAKTQRHICTDKDTHIYTQTKTLAHISTQTNGSRQILFCGFFSCIFWSRNCNLRPFCICKVNV